MALYQPGRVKYGPWRVALRAPEDRSRLGHAAGRGAEQSRAGGRQRRDHLRDRSGLEHAVHARLVPPGAVDPGELLVLDREVGVGQAPHELLAARIEVRPLRAREDLAGVRIEHHRRPRLALLRGLLEDPRHLGLQLGVDGDARGARRDVGVELVEGLPARAHVREQRPEVRRSQGEQPDVVALGHLHGLVVVLRQGFTRLHDEQEALAAVGLLRHPHRGAVVEIPVAAQLAVELALQHPFRPQDDRLCGADEGAHRVAQRIRALARLRVRARDLLAVAVQDLAALHAVGDDLQARIVEVHDAVVGIAGLGGEQGDAAAHGGGGAPDHRLQEDHHDAAGEEEQLSRQRRHGALAHLVELGRHLTRVAALGQAGDHGRREHEDDHPRLAPRQERHDHARQG